MNFPPLSTSEKTLIKCIFSISSIVSFKVDQNGYR